MFKKKEKKVEQPVVTELPKKKVGIVDASLKTTPTKKWKKAPENSFVAPTPENMEDETKGAGKISFVKFLKGEPINLREAIEAKCYDCMAYYADGVGDCGCPRCPLYPFHPYNPNPAKLRKERPDMRKKK
jgi:hypothetical protein